MKARTTPVSSTISFESRDYDRTQYRGRLADQRGPDGSADGLGHSAGHRSVISAVQDDLSLPSARGKDGGGTDQHGAVPRAKFDGAGRPRGSTPGTQQRVGGLEGRREHPQCDVAVEG